MESLDIYTSVLRNDDTSEVHTSPSQVSVTSLQDALANLTAAMFWAEINTSPSKYDVAISHLEDSHNRAVTGTSVGKREFEVVAPSLSLAPVSTPFLSLFFSKEFRWLTLGLVCRSSWVL